MWQSSNDQTIHVIPLAEAFRALKVVSDGRLVTGLDGWRSSTSADALETFDMQLAEAVRKQPPSKFGYADKPSLWTGIHFFLALPALSYAMKKYGSEDAVTREMTFHETELGSFFIAFPHIIRHYQEYQALVAQYGVPSDEWWDKTLQTAFHNVTKDTAITDLLNDLPPFIRAKAQQVLSGEEDSLTGRIVLAYLLNKELNPVVLKIDRRALKFYEPIGSHPSKSLYERLRHAQQALADLYDYLEGYDSEQGLKLGKLLGVVNWYARPHLVEMMIPGLIGAAEPAIRSLLALFDTIIQNGGADYTRVPLGDIPSTQKFKDMMSLNQIGRLSLVKDMLSFHEANEEADGVILRKLASRLYSETERQEAWGNPSFYVPDSRPERQAFPAFRQDIGNILYCAGLVIETDTVPDIALAAACKRLAWKISRSTSVESMRTIIQDNAQTLNDLTSLWEEHYIGHERLRIIRFVRQTFGLESIRPIPILLDELNKSFAGSRFDDGAYYLCYQEAGEQIKLKIKLASFTTQDRAVTYHIIDSETEDLPLTADGLPYSAWLELTNPVSGGPIIIPVPGRGSFDPFGRTGNQHAGEVVGYGCSVHHASLAVALAELASLGAQAADLEKVTAAFMSINYGMHERHDFANFQLALTLEAFENEQMLSFADYLSKHQEIEIDSYRTHLALYIQPGNKSVSWAEPQAARLVFGYPQLYPYKSAAKMNPRSSWYNGRTVEVQGDSIHWQVLEAR